MQETADLLRSVVFHIQHQNKAHNILDRIKWYTFGWLYRVKFISIISIVQLWSHTVFSQTVSVTVVTIFRGGKVFTAHTEDEEYGIKPSAKNRNYAKSHNNAAIISPSEFISGKHNILT